MKKRYLIPLVLLMVAASALQGLATSQDDLEEQKTPKGKVNAQEDEIEQLKIQVSQQDEQIKKLQEIITAHDKLLAENPSHRRSLRVGIPMCLQNFCGVGYGLFTGDLMGCLSISSYGMSIAYLVVNNLYKVDDSFVPVKEKAK